MLLIGGTSSLLADMDVSRLFLPYFIAGAGATSLACLTFTFIEVAKLARKLADRPMAIVAQKLRERLPLLILPALILPLFMSGFTAAKSAIPFLVGYSWDSVWAAADRLIFGEDVWRLTHRLLGTSSSRVWEWFYTSGWGYVLFCSAPFVALYARHRTIGVFFTAMFATWLIGGVALAYACSSAGPVFAGAFDPSLAPRFAELRHFITVDLAGGPIQQTQLYLERAVQSHAALKGGGISAMPSMHLGAAAIYVLASRGTRFHIPAIAFWILIFVGSGYFGYHYWVDGIAGALIAFLCWTGTKALCSHQQRTRLRRSE